MDRHRKTYSLQESIYTRPFITLLFNEHDKIKKLGRLKCFGIYNGSIYIKPFIYYYWRDTRLNFFLKIQILIVIACLNSKSPGLLFKLSQKLSGLHWCRSQVQVDTVLCAAFFEWWVNLFIFWNDQWMDIFWWLE